MFLLRTAFWLGLVVLLLPTDPESQADLKKAAYTAAHRAATFCDRNGETCAKGAEAWAAFKVKLEFGARLASDIISEHVFGKGAPRPAPGDPLQPRATLLPSDMQPQWRGPAGRGAI